MIVMVEPIRLHTRFERARIIGARALQIGMGAPLYAGEEVLRDCLLYTSDAADDS